MFEILDQWYYSFPYEQRMFTLGIIFVVGLLVWILIIEPIIREWRDKR